MVAVKTKSQTVSGEFLQSLIRDIPNFPKQGVVFKDITPLLKSGLAFQMACDSLAHFFKNQSVDYVIGIESRGFIFSAAVACKLNAGFIPIRKKGKLPHQVERISYALEYGEDFLEIHTDAVGKNDRVLIIDDVLATGGTAESAAQLVERFGAKVAGFGFLIELLFLNGRKKISRYPVHSLIQYSS